MDELVRSDPSLRRTVSSLADQLLAGKKPAKPAAVADDLRESFNLASAVTRITVKRFRRTLWDQRSEFGILLGTLAERHSLEVRIRQRLHDVAIAVVVPAHERAIRTKPKRSVPVEVKGKKAVFSDRRPDPVESRVVLDQILPYPLSDDLAHSLLHGTIARRDDPSPVARLVRSGPSFRRTKSSREGSALGSCPAYLRRAVCELS